MRVYTHYNVIILYIILYLYTQIYTCMPMHTHPYNLGVLPISSLTQLQPSLVTQYLQWLPSLLPPSFPSPSLSSLLCSLPSSLSSKIMSAWFWRQEEKLRRIIHFSYLLRKLKDFYCLTTFTNCEADVHIDVKSVSWCIIQNWNSFTVSWSRFYFYF